MRKLLPLLNTNAHAGGRSALTCRFRCGDACFHEVPNTSDNEYVGDVIATALSRRSMMRAAAVVTVAAAAGTATVIGAGGEQASAAPVGAADRLGDSHGRTDGARGLRFAAVAPNKDDKVTVPDGYAQNVVIRWGEPILRGAPAFDADKQTAAAQAGQFGYNNDFLSLLPLYGERGRQVLVANHEYTDEILMFQRLRPGQPHPRAGRDRLGRARPGVVVVEEERRTRQARRRSPATSSTAASPRPASSSSPARPRAAPC